MIPRACTPIHHSEHYDIAYRMQFLIQEKCNLNETTYKICPHSTIASLKVKQNKFIMLVSRFSPLT
jgi:hypothetical protein